MTATSTVDLRRYFETLYREGGEFQSEEYEGSEDFNHSWKHLRTGIVVWKDAIDLSASQVPRLSFTTRGSWLSETSRPLRKKLQRYGPHSKQRGKVQTRGGGAVCTASLNLPTNGQTKLNS